MITALDVAVLVAGAGGVVDVEAAVGWVSDDDTWVWT